MLAFAAPNFVLLQGVIIGLSYGLLAVGLVLIYRTNRVLNFAQGQVGVIAAVALGGGWRRVDVQPRGHGRASSRCR